MAQPQNRLAATVDDADVSARKPVKATVNELFLRFKRIPRKFSIPILVFAVLVAFSCLSGIASLFVPVTVPEPSRFVPSIVPPVEILNPGWLPVYRVDYGCEFVALTDQSGFSVGPSAPVPHVKTTQSTLSYKQKIPVECVGGTHLGGLRVRNVEFRVSVSYFPLGWPIRRHIEYRVESEFDPQGRFLHWVVQ